MENQTNNMYNPLVKAAVHSREPLFDKEFGREYVDDPVHVAYNDMDPRYKQTAAEREAIKARYEAPGESRGNYDVIPGANGLHKLDYTQPKPSGRSFYKLDYSEPVSQMPADVRKNMETMPKSSWDTLLDTIKKYYGFAKNNIKASGGVMNWLGGNSKTLGDLPRWAVAGGGLAGLLGLSLGAKSLLSKSGSYHPVQGLPMAKLASARAMRAEDPTLLGSVSAGRPDITEGNSIGRMLEIIRTHGNQNAPYGATMPKN